MSGMVLIAPVDTGAPDYRLPTRRKPTTRGRLKRRKMATWFSPHRMPGWVSIGWVSATIDMLEGTTQV